jgi:hypothetical protein
MNSFLRWFRRRRERTQIAGRRRELEAELAAHLGAEIRLTPAAVKGGYDEIFYALRDTERVGVVRVNSPFKAQNDPIGPRDLAFPLPSTARLDREWEAYKRLFPLGLSPKPLWRTHDAIACSWLPGGRASTLLTRQRDAFWPVFKLALAATRRMHDVGEVHLDLNLGNLLVSPGGDAIAFIDFEFGPADWASRSQQQAYDYLRLIEDCAKPRRGGGVMLSDLTQLELLLLETLPAGVQTAKMGFVFAKLQRIKSERELRKMLRTVFANLEA